jgi:hypothetical protein
MFSPLGALGALGGGAMTGAETGFDLYQKLQDAESNRIAMQMLSGVGGMGGLGGGYGGATAPSGPPPPPTAGPMSTPSAAALARGLPSVQGSPMMGPGGTMMPGGPMAGGMVQPQAPGQGLPPGMMDPSAMSAQQGPMGGAPMGGGAGGPQMTGSMPMLPQQMQPTAQAPRMSVQPAPLAAARERARQELESTPGLLRRVDELTTAEVGKDPRARQMFMEDIINASAAENVPLSAVLENRKYFPEETYARARREGPAGMGVTPAMFDPINPSNLTNFGTGNASFNPKTGRWVGFQKGPQTAFYRGEEHGIERPHLPWARAHGYAGPDTTALGPRGPQGPGGPTGDIGTLKPEDIMRSQQTGYGPLDVGQMARRIEQTSPNASPMAKFKAMQKVAQLMNQNGQQQLQQLHWMIQNEQRERFHADTERKADERAGRAQEGLDLRERTQLRNSQYVKTQERQLNKAADNLTATDLRVEKIKGHIAALEPVLRQVQITGNTTVDTWLQEARSKLGWSEPIYQQYKTQLNNLVTEMAALNQQSLGSLTVSAREDAKQMAHGVMTPGILKAMGEAVRIESGVTRSSIKKIVDKHQNNINHYMRSKGEIPEEPKEEEAAAAPAAAAPAVRKYNPDTGKIE